MLINRDGCSHSFGTTENHDISNNANRVRTNVDAVAGCARLLRVDRVAEREELERRKVSGVPRMELAHAVRRERHKAGVVRAVEPARAGAVQLDRPSRVSRREIRGQHRRISQQAIELEVDLICDDPPIGLAERRLDYRSRSVVFPTVRVQCVEEDVRVETLHD